jgi:hypothetical protein
LLPRFVLGAQPLAPGWKRALIRPHPGPLTKADGKVPTPLGSISIECKSADKFKLTLALPPGMNAHVEIPAPRDSNGVLVNGKSASAKHEGQWWILDQFVASHVIIESKN